PLRHAESSSASDRMRLLALVNRNRLRYVVKTFPIQKIWGEFVVAERARLAMLSNGIEARFLSRAYLEGILRRDEWLTARTGYYLTPPGEANRLVRLCADLRRDLTAFVRQGGLSG